MRTDSDEPIAKSFIADACEHSSASEDDRESEPNSQDRAFIDDEHSQDSISAYRQHRLSQDTPVPPTRGRRLPLTPPKLKRQNAISTPSPTTPPSSITLDDEPDENTPEPAPMSKDTRARRACFTVNLHASTSEEIKQERRDALAAFCQWSEVRGYVYQLEQGKEGTPHYQGYVEFKSAIRFSTLKQKMPAANWTQILQAPAEGGDSIRQRNVKYCTKLKGRLEPPVCSDPAWLLSNGQGKRSDLDEVCEMVTNGATDREIALKAPKTFARMYRGLRELRSVLDDGRELRPVTVYFMWGPTGIGKSSGTSLFLRNVLGLERKDYFTWSPKSTGNWWDGYQTQDWVFIDELDAGSIPIDQMLRTLDPTGDAVRVPVHGGQVHLHAHNFIICCNKPVEDLYPPGRNGQHGPSERQLDALRRRLTYTMPESYASKVLEKPFSERSQAICDWIAAMNKFGGHFKDNTLDEAGVTLFKSLKML